MGHFYGKIKTFVGSMFTIGYGHLGYKYFCTKFRGFFVINLAQIDLNECLWIEPFVNNKPIESLGGKSRSQWL